MKAALLGLLCVLAFCIPAHADYIYTYTGNTPVPGQLSPTLNIPAVGDQPLTGWFETADPITMNGSSFEIDVYPVAFSFGDASMQITQADAFELLTGAPNENLPPFFSVSVDANGVPVDWLFGIYDAEGDSIYSRFYGGIFDTSDGVSDVADPSGNMALFGDHGSWTVTDSVPTPEPATWLLALAGLFALLLTRTPLLRRAFE